MTKIVRMLKRNALDIIITIILVFLSIAMLYPLAEQVAVSLTTPVSLVTRPTLMWFPIEFTTVAYKRIMEEADILTGYKNTIWLIFACGVTHLVTTIVLAYFWSRKDYNVKLRKPIILFFFFAGYFGGGLVPNYLLRVSLGLYNSLWVIVIGGAVQFGFAMLLKTYFQTIPVSLDESVMLDGGGHGTTMFRIYLPLSKPCLAVIALYSSLATWSSWYEAKLYLRSKEKHPLALIMRNKMLELQVTTSSQTYEPPAFFEELQMTLVAALAVSSTIPFLLIYPFLQKYFQGGWMTGAIKE